MTTTQQVRDWWDPPCQAASVTIPFGDNGAQITVDKRVAPIFQAVAAIFARYGYEIRKDDTGAYVCRRITGGTGYSLHAYKIATDVNWSTNPYGPTLVTDMPPGAIREIEALNVDGTPVLRWGGRYSGMKDAMHFEVIVPPAVAERFVYEEDDWMSSEEVVKQLEKNRLSMIAQHQKDRDQQRNIALREGRLDKAGVDEIVAAIEKD